MGFGITKKASIDTLVVSHNDNIWFLYVCSNINIYESILTIILLKLPSIPPECADLITSRDRLPIVEETLVTVNKSTTVKSCTSKQNTCKLPLLRENLQICGEVGSML